MHRSQPVSNRLCAKRWEDQQQRIHRMRLKKIKPSIDNKAPKQCVHLRHNLKKAQLEEERIATITRDNRTLLKKMTEIMQKNQLDNYSSHRPHSLNREARRRELQRITAENQKILERIQHRDGVYNHVQWEEERRKNEEICRGICQYPYVLASTSGSGGSHSPTENTRKRRSGGDSHGRMHRDEDGHLDSSLDNSRDYSNSFVDDAYAQEAIAEEGRRIQELLNQNDIPFNQSMDASTPMYSVEDVENPPAQFSHNDDEYDEYDESERL